MYPKGRGTWLESASKTAERPAWTLKQIERAYEELERREKRVRAAFAPWGSEEALSLGRGQRHRYASSLEREDGVESHMSLRSIGAAWSESDGRQGARSAPPPGPSSMPKGGAKRRSPEAREAHAITASHVKGRPVIFRGGSQGGLRGWPRLAESSRPASAAAHQRATPSPLRDGKSLPGGPQARPVSSLSSARP